MYKKEGRMAMIKLARYRFYTLRNEENHSSSVQINKGELLHEHDTDFSTNKVSLISRTVGLQSTIWL